MISRGTVRGPDGRAEESLPPPRAPLSAATWRELLYLLSSWLLGVIAFTYVLAWFYAGALLAVTVIGLPVLAFGLLGCRWFGRLERARARSLLGVAVDEPSPTRALRRPGLLSWLWSLLKDPVGWRSALFVVVHLPWALLTLAVTLTAFFVAWPVLPWLTRYLSHVDRALVRVLLSPSDELERRIERYLHDGAQARLVALAMDLGLAKEKLTQDPEAAARMVDEAHGEVKLALQELRDLARGIHPAVLTDRGLGPALSSVATRCTVPVTIDIDLTTRPAPAIEGIAYFTTSELLQNISKHAHAHHATIDIWRTHNRLMLQVTDDGQGGATPTPGSGLAGLAERLTAVDGLLAIDSPHGGPTTITAELPWRDRDGSRHEGTPHTTGRPDEERKDR